MLGDVDAAQVSAVHMLEVNQVGAIVDHGNVIFQLSCFALASHPAAIFFARSSVSVGFVSSANAVELHRIIPAAAA